MSESGVSEIYVRARRALLDALGALENHLDALVLVGAQAIYLHTGVADVAIATRTKDSDVVIDPTVLDPEPLIENAMRGAGFSLREDRAQPGEWLSPDGMPVDLLVPGALGGSGKGRRSANIPPHDRMSARKVTGLEASLLDNDVRLIVSLQPSEDPRTYDLRVAGPTALLIAKLHKLGERQGQPGRLENKDAHDIYRLLLATNVAVLAPKISELRADQITAEVTSTAIEYLGQLFIEPTSLGSSMAGAAERGVGNPEQVAAATSAMAQDLLDAV